MEIVSPCTKVCTLDAAAGICRGCGRTLDEIAAWTRMSANERTRVMTEAPARLADLAARPGRATA